MNDITSETLTAFEASIHGSIFDIASAVHLMFTNTYKSGRLKNKLWFKFDGNKWKQSEIGPYFELSTKVLEVYECLLKKTIESEVDNENKLTKVHFEDEATQLNDTKIQLIDRKVALVNIISRLKNVNFKEAICKECLYLFYDPEFISKLDKDMRLICFQNGVLEKDCGVFRQGKREDMISIVIDMEYNEPMTDDDQTRMDNIISRFETFRTNIVKKRIPKTLYNLTLF